MSYLVKPAAPHHIASLPAIERAAAELFTLEDLPQHVRDEGTSLQRFEDAQRNDRLWVAVDSKDKPVGFLLADVVDNTMHITELDVHPEHSRHGLGGTMLLHVLLVAEHHGHRSVTLTTFSHVGWNAPFFGRHGFVEIHASEYGPELSEILAQERARGLPNRIAMRRSVRRADRTRHWTESANS